MKKQIILWGLGCALFLLYAYPVLAQQKVVSTGYMTDENFVTSRVTYEITTRNRRTTSQGDPEATLSYSSGVLPTFLSVPLAESVMARYPDYRHAYWKEYTYVQGYMFEAMDRLGILTGDSRYLDYMTEYIDHFVDEEGKYNGGGLTNLDNFMTGSAFCTLYARTGKEKYKIAATHILKQVADYPQSEGQFWHGNRKPDMWIDGVFMMQMFLIRYAQYVGETDYCLEVSCRNIISAADHLQLPNGLVLHAWTTEPENAVWADRSTGKSPEVWSEGMGWYTLVVPELLAILPVTHPSYKRIAEIYRNMCRGIKKFQDTNTGGWYMVVDKGSDPLNFIDCSGTAMFTYSLAKGVELGLISGKEYNPAIMKGYECLKPFVHVNERGLLDVIGACDGVVVKKDYREYVTVPKILNAKEAVAGILWAAVIVEKDKLNK